MRRRFSLLPFLLLLALAASTAPAAGRQAGSSAATAPPATTAPSVPVSRSEYLDLIQQAQEQLAGGLSQTEATALARDFRRMGRIELPDGSVVSVKNEAALRLLATAAGKPGASKENKSAIAHLSALEAVVSPAGIRDGDTSAEFLAPEAGTHAARILADKEFRRYDAPRYKKTWWDRMWENIGRAVERFLRWLFGSRPNVPSGIDGFGKVLLYILYFVVGVAALVGLYFLGRTLYERYGSATPRRRAESLTGLDLADEIADPLAEAHALAAEGDLRGAVRFAYIAALRRLRDTGHLVLEKNKTNWEYQRSLRSRSKDAYDTLLPATRLFDFIWYGRRRASRDEFDTVIRIYDALPSAPAPRGSSDGNGASPAADHAKATAPGSSATSTPTATVTPATKPAATAAPAAKPPQKQNPGSRGENTGRKDNPW